MFPMVWRRRVLAAEMSTAGGARDCFSGAVEPEMPNGKLGNGSAKRSNIDAAGIGGIAEDAVSFWLETWG